MSVEVPTLIRAELTAINEVSVRFAHRRPVGEVGPEGLLLLTDSGGEVRTARVRPKFSRDDHAKTFALYTDEPLDFTRQQYRVRTSDAGEARVEISKLLRNRERFYDANAVMGAVCTPSGTTFRLFAPTARSVRLVLADSPELSATTETHGLNRGDHGLWELHLQGDWTGKFYSYRVSTPGGGTTGEVTDPSAVCACGLRSRTMLVDLEETNPPGFDPGWRSPVEMGVDALIYELSVRDFTIAANSGVDHRGLYLGLTETGTHLPDHPTVKTGIDHLIELGVTHVQLMPVQDFDNEETPDGAYNWGYMPVHFNSPDGWYATRQIGDQRIRELKQAVQAFHDRGIGVCMDVVYNHTAPPAPFEHIVPGYYHRRTAEGQLSNGSGCGNEFDSENPMARKFMIESLSYWVTQYGIDGFRFDLMGLHAPQTMLAVRDTLRKLKPNVLIYGEPWTAGGTTLRRTMDRNRVGGTGIAAFNDGFRDAIKGDRDGGPPGYIQTGERIDGVKDGLTGSIGSWTQDPTDTIQYAEAHDNLTTWDKIGQSVPDMPEDIKKRMQCFAGFVVLTAQGVPFIHAGQEFCRSKHGNNNTYNAPDAINQIDWSLKQTHAEVFAYHKNLIALRRAHTVFRLRTGEEVRRRLAFIDQVPHHECVALTIDGVGLSGEGWTRAVILLNGDQHDQTFTLPKGVWQVHADHEQASLNPLREVEQSVALRSHSGMVLGRI
ncbi:MAG: type I pullulanase [bacterium]|nr:type I pullulanase [bacterium]